MGCLHILWFQPTTRDSRPKRHTDRYTVLPVIAAPFGSITGSESQRTVSLPVDLGVSPPEQSPRKHEAAGHPHQILEDLWDRDVVDHQQSQ